MTVSALSSSLQGLSMAREQFDIAAAATAAAGVSDQGGAPRPDLVDGVVGTTVAAAMFGVQLAVLRTTLDTQGSLIDVLA